MDKLEQILESILFLSGDAVAVSDISAKLGVETREVEAAAKRLKEKYGGESGVHILIFNKKLQFASNPDYAQSVETVLNPIKERELSKTMMEVAAIVAYKQPVTRLEIEEIRGVNSDYAVLTLSKHNMIEVVGRKDAIGKPLLYGTTDDFLKRFQLGSLDELPDYDELISRIKILHSDITDLYHKEQYNPSSDNGIEDDSDDGYNLVSTVAEESELLQGLEQLDTASKGSISRQSINDADGSGGYGDYAEDSAVYEAAATIFAEDSADIDEDKADTAGFNADTDVFTDAVGKQDNVGAPAGFAGEQASKPPQQLPDEQQQLPDEELPDFLKDEKDLKVIN